MADVNYDPNILTPVSKEETGARGGNAQHAAKAVRQFEASDLEAAEIIGWPTAVGAQTRAKHLKTAIENAGFGDVLKVSTKDDKVYLVRIG